MATSTFFGGNAEYVMSIILGPALMPVCSVNVPLVKRFVPVASKPLLGYPRRLNTAWKAT